MSITSGHSLVVKRTHSLQRHLVRSQSSWPSSPSMAQAGNTLQIGNPRYVPWPHPGLQSHLTHAHPSFHILQEEPAPPPPPPAEEQAAPPPAKPAWRTVHRKPLVHKREPKSAPAAAPPPVPEVVKPVPSWSTWKRASYPLAPGSWAHLIFILIASRCSESSTGTYAQGP